MSIPCKYCGSENTIKFGDRNNCLACGRISPVVEGKAKRKGPGKFTTFLITIGVSLVIYKGCGDNHTPDGIDHIDLSRAADAAAQEHARATLRIPVTIDFPPIAQNGSRFTFTGHVQDLDSSGEKVEKELICRMKYLGGDELTNKNWQCEQLVVGGIVVNETK